MILARGATLAPEACKVRRDQQARPELTVPEVPRASPARLVRQVRQVRQVTPGLLRFRRMPTTQPRSAQTG